MKNFKIYDMNEYKLLAVKLTVEETKEFVTASKNSNRLMIIQHDTETDQDEIMYAEKFRTR